MYSDSTLPHPLLATVEVPDFGKNLARMEKHAGRPYSLTRLIRGMSLNKPKLDALEVEVDEELKSLNRSRQVVGVLIPPQILNRDLTVGGTPGVSVQTSVEPTILPVLRAKTICGKLGARLLDGLTGPNLKLPRATIGATASWLPEVGGGTDSDPSFDSFTLSPRRIQGSTVISRQLVQQSSPDIEAFIAADLSNAIATAVDNAAINGLGTGAQPKGILAYPVNASGSYTYASRSANVTFGGPATWPNVLAFEKILEAGLIVNDGSFGYATDLSVRDKWQQAQKATNYARSVGRVLAGLTQPVEA